MCPWYCHKRFMKGTGGLGNKRMSGDHPNYIIKIGQNTEESPGDLRRLPVTQTPMRNHQLTIFTNPSTQAGYDTRSIFKRSLTGLNSGFSFSYTSCLAKAEEPSLPYYLPIDGGRNHRLTLVQKTRKE